MTKLLKNNFKYEDDLLNLKRLINSSNNMEFSNKINELFKQKINKLLDNISDENKKTLILNFLQDLLSNFIKKIILKYSCIDKINLIININFKLLKYWNKNDISKDDLFNKFKDYILKFTMDKSPFQTKYFDLLDLEYLFELIHKTYFIYYDLIKLMISKKHIINISTNINVKSSLNKIMGDIAPENIVENNSIVLENYLKDPTLEENLNEDINDIINGNTIIPLKDRERLIKENEENIRKEKIKKIWNKKISIINKEFDDKLENLKQKYS